MGEEEKKILMANDPFFCCSPTPLWHVTNSAFFRIQKHQGEVLRISSDKKHDEVDPFPTNTIDSIVESEKNILISFSFLFYSGAACNNHLWSIARKKKRKSLECKWKITQHFHRAKKKNLV